jgi:hypothetical protein
MGSIGLQAVEEESLGGDLRLNSLDMFSSLIHRSNVALLLKRLVVWAVLHIVEISLQT